MEANRFDALAVAVSEGASRRGVLKGTVGGLAALLALVGFGGEEAAAGRCERRCRRKYPNSRRRRQRCIRHRCRVGCRGRCAPGQECRHGACLDPFTDPGTCEVPGESGPPPCGPAGANCAGVALRSGAGFCLAAARSTPDGNGCVSRGCRRNRDCPVGQVCAVVPGCCPGKPRLCAVPCPAGATGGARAGRFGR